ncbi:GIY-YIG nuclease family protein [Vibrio parahaemolyticus]|uniref:GIY-YIG nuclease family protein n=1 Tax=Vibrio parahaemolyticus TaxID=670 RepID=UPI0022517CE7|nr:GIY-YIG nuclease family protein [Vibrio parahaemolyticus]MCX4121986.1 GIY-YIG nuclease family protein [Vibrio parahaemolyticus]
MSIGRTIRIYLDDGSISGIRHAEIVNWTGQAVSAPRTQVKSLSEWEESKKPGVYFLFGVDESSGNSAVYIGEAENVLDRLQSHIVNKDFWNEVVFFTSKDENLTKSHVKYLESRLVQFAKSANRYSVLNGNEPQQPLLPRGDRDAMEEFLSNIRVLLGVIGHKALEPLAKHEIPRPVDNEIDVVSDHTLVESNFCLNVKNITAKALLTDEGIVVLSGSIVARDVRDSLSTGYKKLRSQLIESGVISKGSDGVFVFTRDQLFTSPSQAAAIIVGYAINGRNSWQTESGKTLKVVEEQVVTSI